MKLLATLILLLLSTKVIFCQQLFKEYVQQNAAVIKSISNDTNYAGFEVLDKAIGDKRVVMLGEQDHGDATTFLAKTKIIKYLHEKKGFNVLAFESDFFALTQGQQEIMNDTTRFRVYMQSNIFPIWPYCDACSELFYQYLPDAFFSKHPITVTGFDNQVHGRYSKNKMRNYLDSVLSKHQFSIPEFPSVKKQVLNWTDTLIKNYGRKYGTRSEFKTYDELMQQIADEWKKNYGHDYNWQLFNSLRAFNNQTAVGSEYKRSSGVRDEQMASNLVWLVNTLYKNEKIIVWAASEHIMKRSTETMKNLYTTMGTNFCQSPENENQTYILGFTSRTGTAGRITIKNGEYKLRKPDKDSYENWFDNAAFTFTDFQPYIKTTTTPESFKMKGINHLWNGKLQWTKNFDGIFYIREMRACLPVK